MLNGTKFIENLLLIGNNLSELWFMFAGLESRFWPPAMFRTQVTITQVQIAAAHVLGLD